MKGYAFEIHEPAAARIVETAAPTLPHSCVSSLLSFFFYDATVFMERRSSMSCLVSSCMEKVTLLFHLEQLTVCRKDSLDIKDEPDRDSLCTCSSVPPKPLTLSCSPDLCQSTSFPINARQIVG
jgi:hypothetical protein